MRGDLRGFTSAGLASVSGGLGGSGPAPQGQGISAGDARGLRLDLLTFSISDEIYALGIESIREIIKSRPITEVPRVPPFVAGIIAVRGIVMPVVDMRLRLRLPAAPLTRQARILVVMHQGPARENEPLGPGEPFGLLVDQVHHVVRLYEADLEPPTMLAGHEAEFVAGIGRVLPEGGPEPRAAERPTGMLPAQQREIVILLDLPRVLTFDLSVPQFLGSGPEHAHAYAHGLPPARPVSAPAKEKAPS